MSNNQISFPFLEEPPKSVIYLGDALAVLNKFPEESIQMGVTSPPYWGLRDYNEPGQLGAEDGDPFQERACDTGGVSRPRDHQGPHGEGRLPDGGELHQG